MSLSFDKTLREINPTDNEQNKIQWKNLNKKIFQNKQKNN